MSVFMTDKFDLNFFRENYFQKIVRVTQNKWMNDLKKSSEYRIKNNSYFSSNSLMFSIIIIFAR